MMVCIKRSYILILSATLVLSCSCRRFDDSFVNHTTKVNITFVADEYEATKASISTIDTLKSNGFKVSAYYGGGYGTEARWLSETSYWKVVYKGSESYFHPQPVRYWPDTGRVDFYASYNDDIVIENDKPIVSLADCNHDFIVARNCGVSCQDVLSRTTAEKFAPLRFKHPLCFLYDIQAKMNTDTSGYFSEDVENLYLRIDTIQASGPNSSTFRFNQASTDGIEQQNVIVGTFDTPSGTGSFNLRSTPLSSVDTSGFKSIIENQFFFFPGGSYEFKITYSLMLKRDGDLPDLLTKTYKKKFTLPSIYWDGISAKPSDANSKLLSGCKNTIALLLPVNADDKVVFHVICRAFDNLDLEKRSEDGGSPQDPGYLFIDDDFLNLIFQNVGE